VSAAFFEAKKAEWESLLGEGRFEDLLADLSQLTEDAPIGDLPGWLTRT
jgi:hypothetical protein